MRVYLTLGNPRSGYVNVNPSQGNLDGLVEAGEASEMVALEVLDRFRPEEQPVYLRHWASRLAPGGTLTVSCPDLFEVARFLVTGNYSEAGASQILYGSPQSRRAVVYSDKTLSEELTGMGLQIVSRRVQGPLCVVVARRPL